MGPRRAATIAPVAGLLESTALQLRVAKRLVPRRGATLAERLGQLDDRLVFVVGRRARGRRSSPARSARSRVRRPRGSRARQGGGPGSRWRSAARSRLAAAPDPGDRDDASVSSARSAPSSSRRRWRTSSTSLPLAYPEARIVHIVRDGRDVVCSLLEKPWLRPEQAAADDAGIAVRRVRALLGRARAAREFEAASDARRPRGPGGATSPRALGAAARSRAALRGALRSDPAAVADELAAYLDAPRAACDRARARTRLSVGRYRAT